MYKRNKTAILFSVASIFLLASCMTADEKNLSESILPQNVTVKPGASVQMSYEAPQGLAVGQYGVLKLSFSESYSSGTLELEARPEDGLRFISEVSKKEFSLAGDGPKEWELDVTSNKDGVYYVSLFALVKTPQGGEQSRAFSARVDVGDITKVGAHNSRVQNGTLSSDGQTVILEAEETIR